MIKDDKDNKCQIIDLALPSDRYFKGSQETLKA